MSSLEDDKKQEVNELHEEYIDYFRGTSEQTAEEMLRDMNPLEIINEETVLDLKQTINDSSKKVWVDELREDIKDVLDLEPDRRFGQTYQTDPNKSKTEEAIDMAQHAIVKENVRPVDQGVNRGTTSLFRYNKDLKIWRPFPRNQTLPLCKDMAGEKFSSHLHNEFKKNLAGHHKRYHFETMGLPKNELLLSDGKILDIGSLEDKDLNSLEQREAGKDDLALHRLNVEYDPDADCPDFKEFIDFLLDGKENQIKTLQEWLGYSLKFPDSEYQKALLILGVSNSGKSQLAELLEEMFSDHSYSNLSFPQLGYQRRFHVGKLNGKILNIEKDLSSSQIDDISTIKQVLSQERMVVERKGDDTYEIKPVAKHLLCANVAPKIKRDDDAFYNRFLTLKAPNEVPREDRVNNLGEKLARREGNGIFMWMLEGLQRLERQGGFTLMPEPHETRFMWNEYGDSISKFLWATCEFTGDPEDAVGTEDLYEWYEAWCKENALMREKKKKFIEKVKRQPKVSKDRATINGRRVRAFVGVDFDEDTVLDIDRPAETGEEDEEEQLRDES